tara:strand:- start:432 stop:1616 length:1185 start_codon:yes stop_codon:yes gene_type:complete
MAIYNSGNMTPEELKMLDGVIEENPHYKKREDRRAKRKAKKIERKAAKAKAKVERKNKKTKIKTLKKGLKKARKSDSEDKRTNIKDIKDEMKYTKNPDKFTKKTVRKNRKTWKKADKAYDRTIKKELKGYSTSDELERKAKRKQWIADNNPIRKVSEAVRDIVRPNWDEDIAYGRSGLDGKRTRYKPEYRGSSDRDDARLGRIYREADESFEFSAPKYDPNTGKKLDKYEIESMREKAFFENRENFRKRKYSGAKGKVRKFMEDVYDEYTPEIHENRHMRSFSRDMRGYTSDTYGENFENFKKNRDKKYRNIRKEKAEDAKSRIFEDKPLSLRQQQVIYERDKAIYDKNPNKTWDGKTESYDEYLNRRGDDTPYNRGNEYWKRKKKRVSRYRNK